MDPRIPLVVSAAVFLAWIVFRLRPALGGGGRRRVEALAEAEAAARAAAPGEARARALAQAGEASAALGRLAGAEALFLRALRESPEPAAILQRAATALGARPRRVERLVLRALAGDPADGGALAPLDPALAAAALGALAGARGGSPGARLRARAFTRLRDALVPVATR